MGRLATSTLAPSPMLQASPPHCHYRPPRPAYPGSPLVRRPDQPTRGLLILSQASGRSWIRAVRSSVMTSAAPLSTSRVPKPNPYPSPSPNPSPNPNPNPNPNVIVKVAFYNGNTKSFVTAVFILEFTLGGVIVPSAIFGSVATDVYTFSEETMFATVTEFTSNPSLTLTLTLALTRNRNRNRNRNRT